MINVDTFQLDSPGFGASIQDAGRIGWRRFGVPPSGWMDDHAATWANRLLDNPAGAAVLELQVQGAVLSVLEDAWIAITGADMASNVQTWRALHVREGEQMRFPQNRAGLWAYVAVEGGFEAETLLGSRSAYPRGRLGRMLVPGDLLARNVRHSFQLPPGVAGRTVPWPERRNYTEPRPIHIWPGPQWDLFAPADRERFFSVAWTVTSQSDRVGYRLSGPPFQATHSEIISEPVRVGSIQVPDNGQPIVTMRDGPTVGGYPKIGLLDSADISRLSQCRPGQTIHFQLAEASATQSTIHAP
jgi:biotin-dependent carboxylase-like uncharacterized protein